MSIGNTQFNCRHCNSRIQILILVTFPALTTGRERLITARKRSLRRLCFYRCVSVHRLVSPSRGGRFSIPGGSPSQGVLHRGGSPSGGGALHPGGTLHPEGGGGSPSGQCAGGMHPTGMHSCSNMFLRSSTLLVSVNVFLSFHVFHLFQKKS